MPLIARQLQYALLAGATTALPFGVGVLKNGYVELALLVPLAWVLLAGRTREHANRAVLLLMSLCVTVTLCDLLLRPLIGGRLHYSPMNLHQRRLPALPMLGRWDPLVEYSGEVYGDLAAMTGNAAFRERRRIEFRTDARGFRNDAVRDPIDLIVLGDSFAAGVGVTQTGTFGQTLATDYHRSVYNLAYPGGPYDQYVNFSIETPSLSITPGADLVWTIFTGNDLDDAAGETWDIGALPWNRGLSAWLVNYRTFRNRSPLRQIGDAVWSRWRGISRDVMVRSLPDGRDMLLYRPQEAWGTRSRDEVERHPNFPKLVKTLFAMKETASRMGVHITVIILPTKGEVYREMLTPALLDNDGRRSGFAEAAMAACEQMSLVCRDSQPYLREEARRLFAASKELIWWRDDTHLNERGHFALASFVIQELSRSSPDLSHLEGLDGSPPLPRLP